jgi:hypothetical protein
LVLATRPKCCPSLTRSDFDTVDVWLGDFETPEGLDAYLAETYCEDDDKSLPYRPSPPIRVNGSKTTTSWRSPPCLFGKASP